MRFLTPTKDGTINFDQYFEYIRSIESKLSRSAYEFASNYDYYSLKSRRSLHDAWVRSIDVQENGSGDRQQFRDVKIRLSLLGPYHDHLLTISYEGVSKYSISSGTPNHPSTNGHGDLHTHELLLLDKGDLQHEITFNAPTSITIVCRDLKFEASEIQRTQK
jgi:hypothetical protein